MVMPFDGCFALPESPADLPTAGVDFVGASEPLGGGKEAALSDAIHVSDEIGAFADISGITLPYADALFQQGVVNLGAPYPSRQWFVNKSSGGFAVVNFGTAGDQPAPGSFVR